MKKDKKSQSSLVPDILSSQGASSAQLPAKIGSKELTSSVPGRDLDSLKTYLKQVSRYPLLTLEEEQELTEELFKTGDIEAAKKLVQSNLRLVVKIAMEYRHAYQNILDLIQEGNIGLMKAVSKYNPEKGAKLSYYASWWIKSYILKFILDNFRLVKIGTTQEQKKLFYNLMKEKDRLAKQGIEPTAKLIGENLGVSEKAVLEMDQRLSRGGDEISLDKTVGDAEGSTTSIRDFIATDDDTVEEIIGQKQELEALKENLGDFVNSLKPRDREIFQKRLLSEVPPTLQNIADEYGVSRERIRQIEARLLENLKVYMSKYIM
jgi:RNA polymerase sigma-32 factor